MKALRIGALAALFVVVIATSVSNAAQLPLSAPSMKSFAGPAACTTLTLTVTTPNNAGNTISTVVITGVPLACQSLALQLTAFRSAGIILATATTPATAAASTTTVTLNASVTPGNIIGVALTINGRGIKTVWVP
jgi:hypothetical protein